MSEADARQEAIDLVVDELDRMQTLLATLKADQARWRTGADGEARVVEVLLDIDKAGWWVLPDRRWPGTARANLDVLVVGPGGVFVVDVKNWRDVRVEAGTVWQGQVRKDDELAKLRDQCEAVEDVLVAAGYPPSQVTPILVLAGRTQSPIPVAGVTVTGERNLHRELLRRGRLLSDEQVLRLTSILDAGCPPMPARPTAGARSSNGQKPSTASRSREGGAAQIPRARPEHTRGTEQNVLLDASGVIEVMMAAACAGPVESWMAWLHPDQSSLVKRSWNGPARIRGAAGTGKTVVALHRAKYLARHSEGRILVTSFVRTVPSVQKALFQRLAPELVDRVEFTTLHSWALRLLRQRGHKVEVDDQAARTAYYRAWAHAGRGSLLSSASVRADYWRDEIQIVIKGRGIADLEEYYSLERIGRRINVRRSQREAVWDLYCEYERLKSESRILDWQDVLLRARDEVRANPVTDYESVIVDEVQDISVVGLQLLHALVGDRRDGLLLVGDGQQSVYTGAFTAAEAGISLTGRAVVLRRNYRNGADILTRALEVVANDEFADLEGVLEQGRRHVDVARPGGRVTEVTATDERSAIESLLTAVAEIVADGVRPGDLAVLCATNDRALTWRRRLEEAGIGTVSLKDYDGLPVNLVKAGTYQRAKGLEFAHVFIPDLHLTPKARTQYESDEAFRERCELEHRQLFVAMTRARDGLWLGRVDSQLGSSSRPSRHRHGRT